MSKAFDEKGAITWLPVDALSVVWAQSQRPLDERFATSIADSFDPEKFGTISVTKRDNKGVYHIIDGQHRKRAVEIAFGGGQKVPCQVFDADDPVRAAQLFDEINSHRRRTHTIDFFKVRVTAKDPDYVAVTKILQENGLVIGYNRQGREVSAAQALLAVYRQHGSKVLDSTLKVMTATWGVDGGAFYAPLIRGYGQFMAEYGDEANWQKIKEGVGKAHTPESLLSAGKTRMNDYSGLNLASAIKEVILILSNKGQKSAKRVFDPKSPHSLRRLTGK